jgi:hypothetical protein
MDYHDIVVKHTNTYIDSMRADIYREVTAKFCADHKIENPYLTDAEMDELKMIKTNNLPNNFRIPKTGLSIYGYYILPGMISECANSKKVLDRHFMNSQIVKVLYFTDGYYSLEYPQKTKYKSILSFTSEYYLLGPNDSECKKFVFYRMHPKNPKNILSRYFIEFCKTEDLNPKYLPELVKYDFFIQKRMGFVNTTEGIDNLRKIEGELKIKVSAYHLEISNLEIQLGKFHNDNEEKIALHAEVE